MFVRANGCVIICGCPDLLNPCGKHGGHCVGDSSPRELITVGCRWSWSMNLDWYDLLCSLRIVKLSTILKMLYRSVIVMQMPL